MFCVVLCGLLLVYVAVAVKDYVISWPWIMFGTNKYVLLQLGPLSLLYFEHCYRIIHYFNNRSALKFMSGGKAN